MILARVQVRLTTPSSDPSDVFVNVWYLNDSINNSLATLADAAQPRFFDFYQALSGYYSSFCTGGELRFYNMADPPPRIPEIRPLGWAGGVVPTPGNLPEEVAVALTYHTVPPITRRRRGRLYLGPLSGQVIDSSDGAATRINDTFTNAVAQRAVAFMNDTRGGQWFIYSKADNIGRVVTGGFVDEAFDTQRRRGPDAISRVVWGNNAELQRTYSYRSPEFVSLDELEAS